ncbi:unnamed protein product [Thelazia callipaeda]|uniref:RPOL4c domain-containing protein n=1 Tax=Thelazia callipaeda TaxID=103827 RepID=A0A158RB38_THECL|nr:unnamed protein product [Thelazia callipaeda]
MLIFFKLQLQRQTMKQRDWLKNPLVLSGTLLAWIAYMGYLKPHSERISFAEHSLAFIESFFSSYIEDALWRFTKIFADTHTLDILFKYAISFDSSATGRNIDYKMLKKRDDYLKNPLVLAGIVLPWTAIIRFLKPHSNRVSFAEHRLRFRAFSFLSYFAVRAYNKDKRSRLLFPIWTIDSYRELKLREAAVLDVVVLKCNKLLLQFQISYPSSIQVLVDFFLSEFNMPGSQSDDVSEEDATELKFPKEFEQADTLLTSEVYLLLEHRRQQSEQKEEIDEMSDVFIKTLNYTRRMARFKNRETIRAVRTLLAAKPLHKFEVAQIANLCPETSEEAKALILSLENKMEDDELDEVLKDLHSKKTFQ